MTTLPGRRSLVQEAAAPRSGAAGPVDAVRRSCDRIEAVDPYVRAFAPEGGRRTWTVEAVRTHQDPADRPRREPRRGDGEDGCVSGTLRRRPG